MAAEFTEELRTHLGDEKFRKFLLNLNDVCRYKKRLLWWQEKAWDQFLKEHPQYREIGYDEVREALQLCEVHLEPLHPDTVSAIYGSWRYPPDYIEAMINRFPHANLMFMGDSVDKQRWKNREVIYCQRCRDETQEVERGSAPNFRHPSDRTRLAAEPSKEMALHKRVP